MRRSAFLLGLAVMLTLALAFAAPRQTAQKASKPKAKKVWTNDDLERLPRWTISTASSEPTPAPAKAAKAEGEEAESAEAAGETPGAEKPAEGKPAAETPAPKPQKEKDPQYWRGQLAPLRQQLQDVEGQIARVRSGVGQAESGGLNVTRAGGPLGPENTLEQLQRRRASLQQQIDAVEDQARRQGIDPGYLR